jgi:hypothetical protein
LRKAEEEYARRLHEAILRIIAGILRVDLGELTRRDIVARNQRLKRGLLLLLSVFLIVSTLAVAAIYQSHRRQELLREASRADHARAVQLLREKKWSDAFAYLARALRYWPENPAAAAQLWFSLRYGRAAESAVPEPPIRLPGYAQTISWSPSGKYLLATANGPNVYLVDHDQRRANGPVAGKEPMGFVPPLDGEAHHLFSRDENRIAVTSWDGRWLAFSREPFRLLDYATGGGNTETPNWSLPIRDPWSGSLHLLLSGKECGTLLRPLDTLDGAVSLDPRHVFPLPAAAWHPTEPFIVVPTGAQTFAIFDTKTGDRLCDDFHVDHTITSFSYDPHGQYLLCVYGDQTGEGWTVIQAKNPFTPLQQGVSKGPAVWLPNTSELLAAAPGLGLFRFSPKDFTKSERLYFDAINAEFSGLAVDLPRLLIEPGRGRFEVFDLRIGWRLAPNDALPDSLGPPVIDATGRFVACPWTPDYLNPNGERNLNATSYLGIWELPAALPAVPGHMADPAPVSDGYSPDVRWRYVRIPGQPLRVEHVGDSGPDWAIEFEDPAIDAAQWENGGHTLTVRYREKFIQHLPWPPPEQGNAEFARFAVLLGGKELAVNGSLTPRSASLLARSTSRRFPTRSPLARGARLVAACACSEREAISFERSQMVVAWPAFIQRSHSIFGVPSG